MYRLTLKYSSWKEDPNNAKPSASGQEDPSASMPSARDMSWQARGPEEEIEAEEIFTQLDL